MRSLETFSSVYLHREAVDMRKSINGLSSIVLEEMGLSFNQISLFVFVSRCGKKLKLLYWDKSGFALWYKRLEEERFRWPKHHEDQNILSSVNQLQGLLSGLDMYQKPHKYLHYEHIS